MRATLATSLCGSMVGGLDWWTKSCLHQHGELINTGTIESSRRLRHGERCRRAAKAIEAGAKVGEQGWSSPPATPKPYFTTPPKTG